MAGRNRVGAWLAALAAALISVGFAPAAAWADSVKVRRATIPGARTGAVLALAAGLLLAACGTPAPSNSVTVTGNPVTVTPSATASVTPLATASVAPTADPDAEARFYAQERGISLDEAKRRLGWQVLAPDLAQRLAVEPSFGGVWIDVATGRVKVGLAGRAGPEEARHVAAAAAAIGLSGAYDVLVVRHTQRELDVASDWLTPELARVNALARGTLVAGQRNDRNVVELQTPLGSVLTPGQRDLVAQARLRLGDLLVVSTYAGEVVNEACVYPYCDQPLRAGVGISRGNRFCTGAFVAKSKTDSNLYQFTAGHCVWGLTGNWTTKTSKKLDYTIGPSWNTMWFKGMLAGISFGDAAILRVSNTSANPTPWVYFAFGPFQNPSYPITSDNYSVQGMFICASGASYGISNCGIVTALNVTATGDGVTVPHLGRASYCGQAGDSGAPVYAYQVAYGIHVSALGKCDKLYQGIRAAESALNVNVLHAAS